MIITVVIPTYRRPQDLARCLQALEKQTRPADEVLIVVRDTDTETQTFLEAFKPHSLPINTVKVCVPGQVAALNAGLDTAQGEIVSITDDDAAPHSDWLERIETHFLADDRVGGVGGRDWVYLGTKLCDAENHPGASQIVGKLQWFGRAIGNHHIGEGTPREVDILKGANMSFRQSAIADLRFDERLRGAGAQVHNDLAFCLAVKRLGWKLIYDPAVAVDHYLGKRLDEDQRVFKFNGLSYANAVHNATLILLEHLNPIQRIAYILWSILVGTRQAFGLLQWLRFLPTERNLATQKLLASLQGRWQGWQTWKQSDRAIPVPRPEIATQSPVSIPSLEISSESQTVKD